MSWSEGRAAGGRSNEEVLEGIEVVNKILKTLSEDSNFQSDIRFDLCRAAIDHWTRKAVLPPEHANRLVENYRVLNVYKRFTELNAACKAAGMGVPVDHILQSRDRLDPRVVKQVFGDEIHKLYNERHATDAADSTSASATHTAVNTETRRQQQQAEQEAEEPQEEEEEQPSDQSIDWKKIILSSLLETIVYGIIAYVMAYTVVKTGMVNKFLDRDAGEADVQPDAADSSADAALGNEF